MRQRGFRAAIFAACVIALAAGVAGVAVSATKALTLRELKRSLAKRPPATVVFDIDDTVLYSTFAFLYGQGVFDAGTRGNSLKDPYFWTLVNDSLDARWSRPKAVAQSLIAFHASRGDTIVFVTGRNASTPPSDATARFLQRTFRLPSLPRVVFTNQKPKVEAFRSLRPLISYGDSDSDIRDTQEADPKIRAIRIVRTAYSSNPSAMRPGAFGEEVLENSTD